MYVLKRKMSLRKAKDNFMKKGYTKLAQEEADQLIQVIKKRLAIIVNKHILN